MISIRLFSAVLAAASLAIAAPGASAQASGLGIMLPTTSVPAAYPSLADAAPVQAALNQFDHAVASHDVSQLLAAGIKPENARGWRRFFRDNPEASITDDCPSSALVISGNTANWSCTETATVVSEKKLLSCSKAIVFTFARTSGGWTISDRR